MKGGKGGDQNGEDLNTLEPCTRHQQTPANTRNTQATHKQHTDQHTSNTQATHRSTHKQHTSNTQANTQATHKQHTDQHTSKHTPALLALLPCDMPKMTGFGF